MMMAMKNIDYIMEYVKEFLDGKRERWEFELDFGYEIETHWNKMKREDREYAELIYDRLLEDGADAGIDLGDDEYEKLIRRKYNDVKSIVAEGFY